MITLVSGQRYGRLVVLGPAGRVGGRFRWLVRCDCGNECLADARSMKVGDKKSCGCLSRELTIQRNTKHGHAKRGAHVPEFEVWHQMIQRCTNPRSRDWEYYGGRGVTIADCWRNDYVKFLADMGRRPSDAHSIDRIDNSRGYEPGNCRWATDTEQSLNRRPKRWYRRPVETQEG